jgi:hypothetical protein
MRTSHSSNRYRTAAVAAVVPTCVDATPVVVATAVFPFGSESRLE